MQKDGPDPHNVKLNRRVTFSSPSTNNNKDYSYNDVDNRKRKHRLVNVRASYLLILIPNCGFNNNDTTQQIFTVCP